MNKRIEWIDNSKGIGIFLVMIGHTMLEPELRTHIYAFHMPLFFLLSGYLFSNKKHPHFFHDRSGDHRQPGSDYHYEIFPIFNRKRIREG